MELGLMGFVDSYCYAWETMSLFSKILTFTMFGITIGYNIRLIRRNKVGAILGIPIFIFLIFVTPIVTNLMPPTTEKLINKYKNGEIDKKFLERFLPYSIKIQREQVWEKKQEEYRKIEAEELLKKIKNEE